MATMTSQYTVAKLYQGTSEMLLRMRSTGQNGDMNIYNKSEGEVSKCINRFIQQSEWESGFASFFPCG